MYMDDYKGHISNSLLRTQVLMAQFTNCVQTQFQSPRISSD